MAAAGQKPGVRVEIARDPGSFGGFEEGWRDLAVARGNAFITPEWYSCWCRFYGGDHEPFVAIARDGDDRLLGVLPLVARTAWPRTTKFAGSALGDHFHPAAGIEVEEEVAHHVAMTFCEEFPRGSVLVLENVEAGATWWRSFAAAIHGAPKPILGRESVLPSIQLAGRPWEEYLRTRSRNLRSQIGRKRRALWRKQGARVRWTQAADDLDADMATLFRLHDARWASLAGASSLTSPRARAFLGAFAAEARDRGWLRLAFLEIDDEPVAAWYGWRIGGRFAYYQAGFDPAWADASVGFVLFAETIRAAIDEGAAEYDMLLGDEAIKKRFADLTRFVCTAVIAPRFRPARLLAATEARVRSGARRLPDVVREPARHAATGLLRRLPLARHR